jgi:DNA polymerase III alpha subunit
MIPIFRSNFSLTSILTLDPPNSDAKENSPDSIFKIAQENSLKEVFIADNTLTGLVSAYETANKCGIPLRFGYRVSVSTDSLKEDADCSRTSSKYIIFSKSGNFDSLIKLHNLSTTKGFYKGLPRLDFDILKNNWDDNLCLTIPFYDSYYFYNLLFGYECVPNFSFTTPYYFMESNALPFDNILRSHLERNIDKDLIVPSKTIYYKDRKSFPAYMTYRCILNRSTFDKPELKHFGSKEFCMESFNEAANN